MTDDPRIAALVAKYTPEGKAGHAPIGFGQHFLFEVGRDDVHEILMELLSAETHTLKMNMFGYDDEELDGVILGLIKNQGVHCQITLDKSQASGVHEKKILTADQAALGADFGNSFAIGTSETHQISHTKGGVLVGQGLWFEGSTNWSASGEGIGVDLTGKRPVGFKAQNNTLVVSANTYLGGRFAARLDQEHTTAIHQSKGAS